jgi:hypothetical protein
MREVAFRKSADFARKEGYFLWKMAENAGKKAGNSQNPDSENESIQPLQMQGWTMITCRICSRK